MKIAFASDNGKSFIDRHFGDSEHYYIYEMKASGIEFVKKIENTTEEDNEEIHADPVKAKGVTEMLKSEDIKVVIAKIFGPNIKRIKKKFVCVLMNDDDISESIKKVQEKYDLILSEWNKGDNRDHINLRIDNK